MTSRPSQLAGNQASVNALADFSVFSREFPMSENEKPKN